MIQGKYLAILTDWVKGCHENENVSGGRVGISIRLRVFLLSKSKVYRMKRGKENTWTGSRIKAFRLRLTLLANSDVVQCKCNEIVTCIAQNIVADSGNEGATLSAVTKLTEMLCNSNKVQWRTLSQKNIGGLSFIGCWLVFTFMHQASSTTVWSMVFLFLILLDYRWLYNGGYIIGFANLENLSTHCIALLITISYVDWLWYGKSDTELAYNVINISREFDSIVNMH